MKKIAIVLPFIALSQLASAQKDSTLSPVDVLAGKTFQTTETVSSEDLNKASGLNLQDAINNVPGVNMSSRTPWGGQHIIIRGYYPSVDNGRSNGENFGGLGYQLFINNIPVTDATGTTVMDDIDYSTLGRVDITKGPSPLFGSFIAGSVQLFTPDVKPGTASVQESAIGGSNGLFRTNTTITSATDHSDFWANYGHQTYDGFRPNDASRKDFLSFASNYRPSEKHTISTYFSYNHSYEQLAGEIDSADFYAKKAISDSNYMLNNSHVDIQSFRMGVTDKYQAGKHFGCESTLFTFGSKLNQAFAHGYTNAENMSFGGRTAITYKNTGSSLTTDGTIGLSFIRTDQNTQGNFILPFVMSPFNPTTAHMSFSDVQNYAMNYSVFTQWVFSMPKQKMALTVGGSLNYVEFGTQNLVDSLTKLFMNDPVYIKVFKPTFTPDISLRRSFGKELTVWASMAMGFAPPTISQMTTSTGAVNTDLKPESAMQLELGAKGNCMNNRVSYSVAIFDLDVTNRLTAETSNSITSYVNVGEQRNMGAEISAGYAILSDPKAPVSLLRPWISYTYMNAEYVDFKNHGKSSTGGDTVLANYSNNKVAGVAPNMFNIGLDLKTKYGFYLYGSFQYMDKVPVTFDNVNYMKSYNLLRARIGYSKTFGKHFCADVFAGADNLMGSTYYGLIFVGQNIQELAQGSDKNIKGGGGDGYILPANYNATFYGGVTLNYKF